MPKKRLPTYDKKPSTPTHPSLSSSKLKDASHSLTSSETSVGNSVNAQIQKLRLSERSPSSIESRASQQAFDPGSNPSLPPSLREILQLPDAPAPRPRPGLRVTRGRRVPAGPAAPQSWLKGNQERLRQEEKRSQSTREGLPIQVEGLPGAYLPDHGSLLATTLKALAKNWDWHKEYDQYYLATIPVRYKEALLHYIGEYSKHCVDRDGLQLLFQDDSELEDGTGAEGLTHLDLATSIGHSLKFSDLKALLSTKESASLPGGDAGVLPESWDEMETFHHGPSSASHFSTLTHLSLAHPPAYATWKGLLSLAPHLSTITHLSLSHWPTPTLSPNSKTAYRDTPAGSVRYGATDFYSALDQDWSEAASIIRRLSKSTYCLQWLDLTGCHMWIRALAYPEIDWTGAWCALETINVSQGWVPACLREGSDGRAWRIVYYSWEGDKAQPAARQMLKDWVAVERSTILLERHVNANIASASATAQGLDWEAQQPWVDRVDRSHWQDDADIASLHRHTSSSTSEQPLRRMARIMFDRGWDAYWIKDAIEEITGSFKYDPI